MSTNTSDTFRFTRGGFDSEAPTDPDATSFYDLTLPPARDISRERAARRRRHLIQEAREIISGLRDALARSWDVGLELEYEERRLAALLATDLH